MVFGGLRRAPKELMGDSKGGVAIILALALVPLTLAAAGSVDLARGLSARTHLQDSLDAATLAAARETSTDAQALSETGARVLLRNLGPSPDMSLIGTGQFVLGENGHVTADAAATVDTLLAQSVMGHSLKVTAHSEVLRGEVKLEIALVLDNTGSMSSGGKIQSLRVAAENFVTTMEATSGRRADAADAVKISLVPFSQTIRVDSSYQNAPWLDQNGRAPINDEIFSGHANRLELFKRLGATWGGCLENRAAPNDINEAPPYDDGTSTGRATLFTPYFAPDEPDLPNGYKNNYLADGVGGSDWRARQGAIAKYVPTGGLNGSRGPNANCTLQSVQRLSTNFASLKADIRSMSAVGNTNIPMGLVWGWHTLSPNAPFADGAAYTEAKVKKIAVLMTDGFNQFSWSGNPNESEYSGSGYVWQGRVLRANGSKMTSGSDAERTAAMDSRLALLCENMKVTGIEIYAVGVQVAASHSGVLKACVSRKDQYYDVANARGMDAAFQAIASQITALHLSR